MALLLFALTSAWAQEKSMHIKAFGTCNVTICQSDNLQIVSDGQIINNSEFKSGTIKLDNHNYDVSVPNLKSLELYGTSDARSQGTLKGHKLLIKMFGASDATLDVDYDIITVELYGSSDLTLKGRCGSLTVESEGVSDINTDELLVESSKMSETSIEIKGTERTSDSTSTDQSQFDEDLGDLIKDITVGISKGTREEWSEEQWDAWGDSLEMRAKEFERQAKKMEKSIETTTKSHVNVNINRPSPYEYRGLLYDANWAGFEAGLNILTPGNLPEWMGLRQMRSWCFNINIADVGIAFNRQHSMGIFTGIGIGWNNYSFNKPMFFEKDAEGYLNATPILDEQGLPLNIERSKIGVFYAQMPLMIEFKPFRQRMYIDLGVTCGMRITSWQTIEFGRNYGKYAILGEGENAELIAADKTRDLQHKDLCVNFFKVDATLRAGSVSDDIGFFVKYSLLPLFTEGKVKDADGTIVKDVLPLNIGFSINF